MIVRKLRLSRGWSQEQLADLCNLSIRTIQRVERGGQPSLETLNALAAVFEVNVVDLTGKTDIPVETDTSTEEQKAIAYVRSLKRFYGHLLKSVLILCFLLILNIVTSPNHFWVIWPALGMGIGLFFHALKVFEVGTFFGGDWEQRQIAKRLNKQTRN